MSRRHANIIDLVLAARGETWLSLGAGLIGVYVLAFVDVTICPTAGLLGIPCPSCGLTRATTALIGFHFRAAAQVHPGVFLVWPYVLCAAAHGVRANTHACVSRSAKSSKAVAITGACLVVLMTAFWLARFWGFWNGPVAVRRWF